MGDDTMRSIMYTGRPMRFFKTPYNVEMEEKRRDVIQSMQDVGIPAWVFDMDAEKLEGASPSSIGTLQLAEVRTQDEIKDGVVLSSLEKHKRGVFLTGQCAGAVTEVKPARAIIEEMVQDAAGQIR